MASLLTATMLLCVHNTVGVRFVAKYLTAKKQEAVCMWITATLEIDLEP